MSHPHPLTILCLASYEKGADFMRACKELGCRVLLITQPGLADARWPREALDDIYFIRDMYNRDELIHGISYLARSQPIDRVVALDDFDVEHAATLREHLRLPGIGDSVARFFRDKLAMRAQARAAHIRVPEFVHVLNHQRLHEWMERVPAPWVLKPRSEASAVGIQVIEQPQQLWSAIEALGDRQSFYLLEQYISGPVYHVDSLTVDGAVIFAEAHQYVAPLLDVVHKGGIFGSRTLPRASNEASTLLALNQAVLLAMGLQQGASHTEFIRSPDGEFYFLETSARVGGANISDLVAGATGINLWREWAAIEVAGARGEACTLPPHRQDYAAIIVSLARQEHPDTGAYNDPEIVWRLNKPYHAGLVVASPDSERIDELLTNYVQRFTADFWAALPAPDKPTS